MLLALEAFGFEFGLKLALNAFSKIQMMSGFCTSGRMGMLLVYSLSSSRQEEGSFGIVTMYKHSSSYLITILFPFVCLPKFFHLG